MYTLNFKSGITTLFFICSSYLALAQKTLTKIQPAFFTTRNARISIGGIVHANGIDKETGKAIYQIFNGVLPEEHHEIGFGETTYPYLSGGLYLDWFSPNSRTGFMLGAEYNNQYFSIDTGQKDHHFRAANVIVPFYLKFKSGGIHSKTNFKLLLGAFYSLPVHFDRTTSGITETFSGLQQAGLGLSTMISFELRFTKKEAEAIADEVLKERKANPNSLGQVYYPEYPRAWLFIRADHPLHGLFSPDAITSVLPGFANKNLDYRVTNFSIGLAFFLGGKMRVKR